MKEYNPQSQPKIVWPAAFPVVRSYLDQLVRDNGLAPERTTAIASALDAAEKQSGGARRKALDKLASQVDSDVKGAKDPERVRAMAAAIRSAREEHGLTLRRRHAQALPLSASAYRRRGNPIADPCDRARATAK